MTLLLSENVYTSRVQEPSLNLPPALRSALKDLRKRNNMLILPADNGKTTVVLDKSDYDENMMTMLSDGLTYYDVC